MSEKQAEYTTRNGGDPFSPPQGDGAIAFDAVVYKVQTLVDNGIRVTLDLPETAIVEAAQMMECQRRGVALVFTVKQECTDFGRKVSERPIRKSQRQAA